MDPARPEAGMIAFLEIQDPHVRLDDVIDRGINYLVPTTFCGSPIKAHTLNVGILGLSRLEPALVDARNQPRGKVR